MVKGFIVRIDCVRSVVGWLTALALLAVLWPPASAVAQAPTLGVVEVTVVSGGGQALAGISVSLERGGTAIRTAVTDRAGRATFNGVASGDYAALVEQFGYQPVRYRGIRVEGGGRSRLTTTLRVASGAVTQVDEQTASVAVVGGSGEEFSPGWRSGWPAATSDAAVFGLGSSALLAANGRPGLFSVNGLAPTYLGLSFDGRSEGLLRHPAHPAEPLLSGVHARQDVQSWRMRTLTGDPRQPAAGGVLDLRGDAAGARTGQQIWGNISPGVGASGAESAGDSTAISFRAGALLAGRFMSDTGAWQVGVTLFRDQFTSAHPFASEAGRDGEALATSIRSAATAGGWTVPAGQLVPRIRSSSGGQGSGALSWRIGELGSVSGRVAAASWTEVNPVLAGQQVHGNGAELKASDYSTGITAALGAGQWTSTTSFGLRGSSRDWSVDGSPFTALVTEGVAWGTPDALPGTFKVRAIEFSQVASWRMSSHLLRGGFSVQRTTDTWDWTIGGQGRYLFGDVASLQAGEGSYLRTSVTAAAPAVTSTRSAAFLQDSWRVTPEFELNVGVRFDKLALPDSVVRFDETLENISGAYNRLMPLNDRSAVYPMGSFRLDADGSGRTVLSGGAALAPLDFDRGTLSEVARYSGGVSFQRADGAIGWGTAPTTTARNGYTIFAPGIQRPRATQMHLALAQRVGSGATLTLRGGYTHADYLVRRTDWNRHQLVPSTGADGRPIYGDLVQYGGLIVPASGSNRRYPEFDFLAMLTGDGYADHYEAGIELEQPLATGLRFRVSYTFGQTKDNLVGQLSLDPADRISPFPDGLDGVDWAVGRSDLDVPHRFTADLLMGGTGPLALTARYRFQSGLPFTPGAPRGVDLNGDGAGGNDPIALGQSIPGMASLSGSHSCLSGGSGFAARNVCRDPGVHALDLGLTWRMGAAMSITVDAVNAFASPVGLRDHAAVRVDPDGSITRNGAGRVVLPLIANERFGELISRRGDPRLLRFGFRLER